MYHAQWAIILDDEFLKAYKHGMSIKCCDGIWRRFFPHIFTYSADYPEKYYLSDISILKNSNACYRILLAGIRNLGRCPCPRCLIPLDRAPNMGRPRDMVQRMSLSRVDNLELHSHIKVAREMIYMKNYKTDSKVVEDLLRKDSLVLTMVGVCLPLTTNLLMLTS